MFDLFLCAVCGAGSVSLVGCRVCSWRGGGCRLCNSGMNNELASLYRCFGSVCLVALGCAFAFWIRCTCVFVPALRLVGAYRGSRLLGSSFVRIVDRVIRFPYQSVLCLNFIRNTPFCGQFFPFLSLASLPPFSPP